MRRFALLFLALAGLAVPAAALAARTRRTTARSSSRTATRLRPRGPVVTLMLTGSVIGQITARRLDHHRRPPTARRARGDRRRQRHAPTIDSDTAAVWGAADGFKFRAVGGTYTILDLRLGCRTSSRSATAPSMLAGMPGQAEGRRPLLAERRRLQFAARRRRRSELAIGAERRDNDMATKPQTVLVVEDEASIASFVAAYLKNAGYAVRTTASGAEALKLVESEKPALVVLDLMLPDMDGVEVCKRIRQRRPARADADRARRGRRQDHRARGRRRRLHDEAVQPARARGACQGDPAPLRRRSATRARASARARRPHDRRGPPRGARSANTEIQLAPKEFDLLWELLDHRGLVLTRDQLLERVWGYTFAGDTRTVDVHVRQLRRKLGDASPIVTVWGVGYKVSPAREPTPPRSGVHSTPCSGRCAFGFRRSSCSGSCSPGSSRRRSRSASSRSYTHARAVDELRSESVGIVRLYATQAGRPGVPLASCRARSAAIASSTFRSSRAPTSSSAAAQLARARRRRPSSSRARDPNAPTSRSARSTSRSRARSSSGAQLFGALVVAKPQSQLRSRLLTLIERLAIAFGGGVVVAGLLGIYLTRRITRPLGALAGRRRGRRRRLRGRATADARYRRDLDAFAALRATWRRSSRSRRRCRATS